MSNASRLALLGSVVVSALALGGCTAEAGEESVGSASSAASIKDPVDQSLLTPPLLDRFGPWSCRRVGSGDIICDGEEHINDPWVGPIDFPCADPVYYRLVQEIRTTRTYNSDNLLLEKRVHQSSVESFSLSPAGANAATLGGRFNYIETPVSPGAIPYTIVTNGAFLTLKGPSGGVIYNWNGQIREFGADEGFSGNANSPKGFLNQPDIDLAILGGVCEAIGSSLAL
jgi:hypothetical protein